MIIRVNTLGGSLNHRPAARGGGWPARRLTTVLHGSSRARDLTRSSEIIRRHPTKLRIYLQNQCVLSVVFDFTISHPTFSLVQGLTVFDRLHPFYKPS